MNQKRNAEMNFGKTSIEDESGKENFEKDVENTEKRKNITAASHDNDINGSVAYKDIDIEKSAVGNIDDAINGIAVNHDMKESENSDINENTVNGDSDINENAVNGDNNINENAVNGDNDIKENTVNGDNAKGTADSTLSAQIGQTGQIPQNRNAESGMPETKRIQRKSKFVTSYIAKTALLTAVSFLLYFLGKFFKLSVIFPYFLDLQISELPAILAGFSMGPLSGAIVIVLKCLIKLPMSSTQYVGELTDIILGLAFVLPPSIMYKYHKNKKFALIGLGAGTILVTIAAVITNYFISIPFYVQLYFGGDFSTLVNSLQYLYPEITVENFYGYYLGLGIVPFNIFRCLIVSGLTFVLYKKLSKILHWDGTPVKNGDKRKRMKIKCEPLAQNSDGDYNKTDENDR